MRKAAVFVLTFFSYALYHASRKVFSVVKSEMSEREWLHSKYFALDDQAKMDGLLDTLFLFFYAIGLFISGYIGDRIDSKHMIVTGMYSTAVVVFSFGAAALLGIHSLSYFATLWAINGAVQSTGWPANVAVMARWYGPSERGTVMGLWSSNASFGNIFGTGIVVMVLAIFGDEKGWMISLIVVAGLVAIHATLIKRFLIPQPLSLPAEKEELMLEQQPRPKPIAFLKAWLIPGVIPYALAYACLKSVNYALFFWLPFYLSNALHMSDGKADGMSMLYDVGQCFGGVLIGYATDRIGMRSPIVVVMLLCASVAIHLLSAASVTEIGFLLVLTGFLVGGPANLISTAISADLGAHKSIHGNAAALSTVTGIIDGTGSIGAAFAQYLVGYLAHCHTIPAGCDPTKDPDCHITCSWQPVLQALVIGTCCASLCLAPLVLRELRRFESF